MSIPIVGRSPIIDRPRGDGDGGRSIEGRVPDGPAAISAGKRRRAAPRATVLAFLATLVVTLGGVQVLPTRYSAISVVSFMPRPAAMTSADTVRLLVEKYAVLATSATITQTAADAVKARPGELAAATTATLDAGTGNLEIAVVRASRQQAVDAANAVADALVRRSRYDGLVEGEATSPAVASRTMTKPSRSLLRGAGALAAVLVAALTWTLMRGRRRYRATWDRRRLVGDGAW